MCITGYSTEKTRENNALKENNKNSEVHFDISNKK